MATNQYGIICKTGPGISLPLMGIGNQFHLDESVKGDMDSLPLMGIGNVVADVFEGLGQELITPHGDWQPERAQAGDKVSVVSLPLMGIGNSTTARRTPLI